MVMELNKGVFRGMNGMKTWKYWKDKRDGFNRNANDWLQDKLKDGGGD